MRLLDAQGVQDAQPVPAQLLHGVLAGRGFGQAVAAQVRPEDTMRAGQGRGLRVPDVHVGAEGVQQQDGFRLGRPFRLDMDAEIAEFDKHGARSAVRPFRARLPR